MVNFKPIKKIESLEIIVEFMNSHGDFCCKNMVLIYISSELYYMRKWNPNSAVKLGLFVSKMIFGTWIAFGGDNVI